MSPNIKYTRLIFNDEGYSTYTTPLFFHMSQRKTLILSFVFWILSVLLSFVAGRGQRESGGDAVIKLDSTSRIFQFDARFGARPSPESNEAWKSLFPIQGGFFKHPQIAPERSAFSVFHTLHCVDGLRHGYYSLFDAMSEGRSLNVSDLPFHASPDHVHHCLDLLRQNIMCQPDLTIELVNNTIGGVTGFGTEHRCKSWEQLNGWMAQWEGWQHTPKQNHEGDELSHDHIHR